MNSYILVNLEKIFERAKGNTHTLEFHFLVPCSYEQELTKILDEYSDVEISEWFKEKDFDQLIDLDWNAGFIITKQRYDQIYIFLPATDY